MACPVHLAAAQKPPSPVKEKSAVNPTTWFTAEGEEIPITAQFPAEPETERRWEFLSWSGQRGSNSLPPPWQGGALPDELCPHKDRVPKRRNR